MSKHKSSTEEKGIAFNRHVSSSATSEPHEKWLTKFNKRKDGKLFNLKFKYESLNSPPFNHGRPNRDNFCANALWIAIKGTKMEEDGKFFVELLDAEFFNQGR
jgi:hypothetical protein